MKVQIKKAIAENHIKKIKQQLEELEAAKAQSQLQPMERTDDTFLMTNFEDKKQKLLHELEKYEKALKAG